MVKLENIATEIKNTARALGLGAALFLGAAGIASAQEIDHSSKYFFECNYWEDTHGDNSIYSWDQYHGIKRDFKDNEEIILVGHDPNWRTGDKVKWILYGPSGQEVEEDAFTLKSDGEWYHAGESADEDIMLDLLISDNGGNGNYRVEWYTNGQQENLNDNSWSKFTVSSSK